MKNLLLTLIACFSSVYSMSQTSDGKAEILSTEFNNHYFSSSDHFLHSDNKLWDFDIDDSDKKIAIQKSIKTDSILLDSIYKYEFISPIDSVLIWKVYIHYNLLGKSEIITYWELDTLSDQWLQKYRYEYFYDINGYDSLNISCLWNTTENKWIGYVKNEFTYNSNGIRILQIQSHWDQIKETWIGTSKTENILDEYDNLILLINFQWNTVSAQWEEMSKKIYAYDKNKNLILSERYMRYSNTLRGYSKLEYEFDDNGKQVMHASYNWNNTKGIWQGTSKHVKTDFDEFGHAILTFFYAWDLNTDDWIYSQKTEHEYIDTLIIKTTAKYFWDSQSSQWKGNSKTERYFNIYGRDSIRIEYQWNPESLSWNLSTKTESTEDLAMKTIVKISFLWNIELKEWEKSEKEELVYYINNLMGSGGGDRIKSETKYDWDKIKNEWIVKYIYEATYSESGKWTGGTTYSLSKKDVYARYDLIYSFDTDSVLDLYANSTCYDHYCRTDSDCVEGNGSVLRIFGAGNLFGPKEYCIANLKNNKSIRNADGFYIYYKVLNSSGAVFGIKFKETSGEVWRIKDKEILSDDSQQWKRFLIPFNELTYISKEIEGNGILSLTELDSIQFVLYNPGNVNISGSVLLDNLSTFNFENEETLINSSKYVRTYDEHDNLIHIAEFEHDYYIDTLKPVSQTRYDIKYDNNQNQTLNAEYIWNSYSDMWRGTHKYERTFDDSSRITSYAFYQWSTRDAEWYSDKKTLTEYDNNGNISCVTNLIWDELKDQWIPKSKKSTFYDNNHLKTKEIYSTWNETDKQWALTYEYVVTKSENIYDKERLILQKSLQWNHDLQKWIAIEKDYYFYSFHELSALKNQSPRYNTLNINIFPNPFSNNLIIEVDSKNMILFVCDILGRQIFNTELDLGKNEISLKDNDNALYIIYVYKDKNIIHQQKVIKL